MENTTTLLPNQTEHKEKSQDGFPDSNPDLCPPRADLIEGGITGSTYVFILSSNVVLSFFFCEGR